jgi:hypothetical protein
MGAFVGFVVGDAVGASIGALVEVGTVGTLVNGFAGVVGGMERAFWGPTVAVLLGCLVGALLGAWWLILFGATVDGSPRETPLEPSWAPLLPAPSRVPSLES